MIKLDLYRLEYFLKTTIGKLYLDGELFSWTLEDVVRPEWIKIPKHTAIIKGEYKVTTSYSNRFKRIMPELLNVPQFTGIRLHGGNTHLNTEGCILTAKFRPKPEVIQGSAEKELTKIIKGKDCIITIYNLPQN